MDVMGKVREESPGKFSATDATKPSVSKPARRRGRLAPFFGNLVRADRYKPTQGRRARLGTALGLGLLVGAGLLTAYGYYFSELPILPRYLIPTALAAVGAWLIWRIVEYPPFVDFLIATEAEMNKVSWTNRADLYRATIVVLTTVLILSLFLFGVDLVWSRLLQAIHVLRFDGSGAFGSQAG
jgi:preprotein translocase subunit SecE